MTGAWSWYTPRPPGAGALAELWPAYLECIRCNMAPLVDEELTRLGELLEKLGATED